MKANVITLAAGLSGLYLERRIQRERAVTVIVETVAFCPPGDSGSSRSESSRA